MSDPDLSRSEWQHTSSRRRRCPRCHAFSRLTHSILDPRHGNVIRLYHPEAYARRSPGRPRKQPAPGVRASLLYKE
jgi:hypothetical protein